MTNGISETPRLPHPLPPAAGQADQRTALLSIVGYWIFYFLLNTLHMALVGAPEQGSLLGRRTVVAFIGMGLTFLLYLVLRRFERSQIRILVTVAFLASIPVTVAYAVVNYAAFYVVSPPDSILQEMAQYADKHTSLFEEILDRTISWYFFVASWAVLYIALSYAARVRQAERRASLFRAEAQTAQLRALRYQINPHFLFNTLNSLSTLVLRARNEEAERMIANLAAFFRSSLTADPAEDVPLLDEIRMQQLYLDIEQIRYPQRLLVDLDIEPEAAAALVPGLILQPLVENAVKYGVSRTSRPVTITIRAHGEAGRLHLSVEDDGELQDSPAACPANGYGVGLRNVSDRLATRFDGAADCRYGPRPEGGFRVDLVLPWV